MWMAEGFVKSNGNKSLEEEAEGYLKALVERNLVLVRREKSNGGKAMSYGMHDLLRKASEEKFFYVLNDERVDEVRLHNNKVMRRVSVQTSYGMAMEEKLMSLARSFICAAVDMPPEIATPMFLVLRLVRVLDVFENKFEEFPETLQLVNLRYLAFSCSSRTDIPGEISRLLNLKTLIGEINGGSTPTQLWEMSELRHLKLDTIIYIKEGYMKQHMQEKLQRINTVRCNPSLISMGFFETIPNIKNLGIYWEYEEEEEVDLRHLHKLQTLRCESDLNTYGCHFLLTLRFPCNLRKLTLSNCVIFPRVLTTLCALLNLEVLKIGKCVFKNQVFEVTEGDVFYSLQFLNLYNMSNLLCWRGDATNFPTLCRLHIGNCPLLEEIPNGIGDISTLQLIHLYECSPSLTASAKEIQKVQQDEFDNYDLQLTIYD